MNPEPNAISMAELLDSIRRVRRALGLLGLDANVSNDREGRIAIKLTILQAHKFANEIAEFVGQDGEW